MFFVVDNYDSFTYNLVQYLGEMGAELLVRRNDMFTLDEVERWKPDHIVISPGPCTPREAGLSNEVIRRFGGFIPILGVCLGHQCIGHVYGGEVILAPQVMHGKTSVIHHGGAGILKGVPSPFEATRYHSLIVKRDGLPEELGVTAWTEDGIIMGLQHREHPVFGVQFHPESILTVAGKTILKNFLQT